MEKNIGSFLNSINSINSVGHDVGVKNKELKGPHERDEHQNENEKEDFKKILQQDLINPTENSDNPKISAHAMKRINERKLDLDGEEFMKLKNAITKLRNKGGKDSLVITDKAAYIIDVAKNTVVTAIDKQNISENIFTKIDSTVIID